MKPKAIYFTFSEMNLVNEQLTVMNNENVS